MSQSTAILELIESRSIRAFLPELTSPGNGISFGPADFFELPCLQ